MSSLDDEIIECVSSITSADDCNLIKEEDYLNNDTEQTIVNNVKFVEKSALENSTATQSVKSVDELQKVTENVEPTEDEDEDSFGGFVAASFTSVGQNHVESSEADNFSGCTTSQVDANEWVDFSSAPFPAQPVPVQDCCLNFTSLTKQMQSVLSCAFPSNFDNSDNVDSSRKLFRLAQVLDDDLKEDDENSGSHFCITSRNLWHSLRTIEDANALNYRWANSLLYNVYLSALGMNVTLAQSAKSNLPLFATQLTSSSLIPEKLTSSAAASSLTFSCQNKVPVSETVDFASSSQNGVDQISLSSAAPFNITAVDLDIFLRDEEPDKGGKAPWEEDLELLGLGDVNLKGSSDMRKSAGHSNFKFGNGNATGLSSIIESNSASSVSTVKDVKK